MKTFVLKSLVSLVSIWLVTSCALLYPNTTKKSIEIEFYSIGAGIDFKAKKLLEEFIVNYTESTKVTIPYTTRKHGKEGETTFAIDVSKLSKKEKNKFEKAIKDQLKTASNCRVQ